MSVHFLSKQNTDLLWNVLEDEPTIQKMTRQKKEILYKAFSENLNYFFETEKEKGQGLNLTFLNKKFLTQLLKIIRNENNFPQSQTHLQLQPKNNLKGLEKTENYKIEDIQTERLQMFDKQFTQKKKEFENSYHQKKPPVPNFTENIENDKIKNIDELLAQQMAQRKLDYMPVNNIKESQNKQPVINTPQQNNFKLIKIQDDVLNAFTKNEIIDLSENQYSEIDSNTTDVSENIFHQNDENNINENEVSMNILGKLKIVQQSQNEMDSSILLFREKLDSLEEKINEINNNIKIILDKINTEMI
jgi:hypothetical protein